MIFKKKIVKSILKIVKISFSMTLFWSSHQKIVVYYMGACFDCPLNIQILTAQNSSGVLK